MVLPAVLALASLVSVSPVPQSVPGVVQFVSPVPPPPTENVLRAETYVPLRLAEELTTRRKFIKIGHRFKLEVMESVIVNGFVVIPAGSPAVGEVIDIRYKGGWGRSGRIGVRVLYVRANGRQIRLSGAAQDKGIIGTAGVATALAVSPVTGFFFTGTSATIPLGTLVKAYVDEDIAFYPAATTVPAFAPVG